MLLEDKDERRWQTSSRISHNTSNEIGRGEKNTNDGWALWRFLSQLLSWVNGLAIHGDLYALHVPSTPIALFTTPLKHESGTVGNE